MNWAQSLNLKVSQSFSSSLTSGDDRSTWCTWIPERLRQLVSHPTRTSLMISGLRGTRQWFTNTTNVDRTVTALQTLTTEFTQSSYGDAVLSVELINEPFPYTPAELSVLQSFYLSAYGAVRTASQQSTLVVAIDEAFQGLQAWQNFMLAPEYENVALDTVSVGCRRVLMRSTSTPFMSPTLCSS